MAALTETVFFSSDDREPWRYIPTSWVRTGSVFITGDDRFYRLVREESNGWWCEDVPPEKVGSPAKVGLIRARLMEYQLAAEAIGELAAGRERAAAQARAEHLREELMRLCNERPWFDVDQTSARGMALIAAASGTALAALYVMIFYKHRWVLDGSDTRVPWVRTVLVLGGIAVALLVLFAVYLLAPISTRRRLRLPGRRTRR